MNLPVSVGDTITDEHACLPHIVTRVHVQEPMSDEQRETAKYLGYTLGRYEEPCIYIEYKVFGHTGSTKVHMKPDEQGRLVTMLDPDSWAGGRYSVSKARSHVYVQQDLFQENEASA